MTIRFSHLVLLFLALGTNSFAAENQISFNGKEYLSVYSETVNRTELTEYLREGETLDSWEQMISIRIHSDATRVSDVMNPYAEARKSLYIRDVSIYWKSEEPGNEDVIFEFLLKSPDDSFVEFALVRAVSKKGLPVVLYVLSKKIPMLEESKTMDMLKATLGKRGEWFRALGSLSLSEASDKVSEE